MAKKSSHRGSMHIKRSTEGTSNELSFSVLDAKKNAPASSAKDSPKTITELGKVSVFTVPGKASGDGGVAAMGKGGARRSATQPVLVAGTAELLASAQGEIARRKTRRSVFRALNVMAVLAVLALIATAAASFFMQEAQRRQSAEVVLAEAVDLVKETDAAVIALDLAVEQPSRVDAAQLGKVLSDASAAIPLLDRAANRAEEVGASQNPSGYLEEVQDIKEVADARKALVGAGQAALELAAAAQSAGTYLDQSWEKVIEANRLAGEAAGLASASSPEEVSRSSEVSAQAIALFQDASVLARQAKEAFPQVDLDIYSQYLEKRSSAQQSALASNAAILEQNRVAAESNSAAYNASEEEAVILASKLPASPSQLAVEAYAPLGSRLDEAYRQARERSALADAALRAYLDTGE